MRHQHYTRLLRLSLLAGLVIFASCAEEQDPAPTAGLLTDFASGVDASFAVETFQAADPSLQITAPKNYQGYIYKGASTKYPVEMVFAVSNFQLGANDGKIRCFVDGLKALTTFKEKDATTNTIADLKTAGLHTIACNLIDKNGTVIANTQQRIYLQLRQACATSDECNDGNACSIAFCIGGYCNYEPVKNCCNHAYDCLQGETCNNPGANSKCTTCTTDIECDDNDTCTTDKCDLSGPKGKCTNIKPDPECCTKSGEPGKLECDDGLSCTIDSCDTSTGKCKHETPAGVCCFDSECKSDDPCQVGSCIGFQCRYNPDKFKPGCCSSTTNPNCNDDNNCTIDACEKPMDGGAWKQCVHTKDPKKPECCAFDADCDDGNACTGDACIKAQEKCIHIPQPGCCAADKDCDDSNFCTTDTCDKVNPTDPSGKCMSKKLDPLCCVNQEDCNDGLFCTSDKCDIAKNKCSHIKSSETCCDLDSECKDGNLCTKGVCVNHGCNFIPDKFKPNCCDTSADCNDGKVCTIDSCDTSTSECKFVDNGDPTCCNGPDDCDDQDCSTLNFCDSNNKCAYKKDPTKCAVNLDCDDGNACTKDVCDTSGSCGECKYLSVDNCCLADFQCDDGNLCTVDACGSDNKCSFSKLKDCCIDDKDAVTACDDNNACTIDYCLNNTCRHTAPKDGCCAADKDCDDGNKCSKDVCSNIVAGKGSCSYSLIDGCTCANNSECNDNNVCTTDKCIGGLCNNKPVAGCCIDKFDCDDKSPCTTDFCVFNGCVNVEFGGAEKKCCSKATEAEDCASLNTNCSKGVCETQPDNSRKCVSAPVDICTVQVNFCQDFSTGTNLKAMGWNPGDVKGKASGNWKPNTDGALGPDKYAEFTWTPTYTDYDTCLQSPIIQAAGSKKITLQYDRLLDINKGGATTFRLLGSLDGKNVDWTKATLIDMVKPSKDEGPSTMDVILPPGLSGSNGLRLAFCVSGKTTFDVTRIGLDNVCVVKGQKPSITTCPPNQIIKLNGKKSIPIKAKDPDTDALLSFSIVKGPAFVSLASALYYWLDASWNTTLTINPTLLDHVGTHEVTIKISDGLLYSLCTFKITVTHEGGYLIWKPTEVPLAAGEALFSGVKPHVAAVVQMTEDLSLFSDLSKFKAIFVTLGVFPDNHVLNATDGDRLKLYLQQGGRLYMESGDTWSFDKKTSVHPLFHVKAVGDQSDNGIANLKGKHIYKDVSQTPMKYYSWDYSQDFAWNNLNDSIEADTNVKGTRSELMSDTAKEKFWTQVTHDNVGAKYRTVASSMLFGGVKKGITDEPNKMMERIIAFFDGGYVDCNKDSQCDDNNKCTTDKCVSQLCEYTEACTCVAANKTPLGCGDKQQLVTNSANSTHIVDEYKCDPGVKYTGKEIAYIFSSNTSKPVKLKVSNLNNTKAKVFVMRAQDKGTCAPEQCIASGTNGVIEFPAAKLVKYHIVLDVQDDGTAQADIEFECGTGEICDDGIDNNGNSLVDCNDVKSCCGDAACGEICDGVDNDCDGSIDEGCDDDGDDYCDESMTIKGTPPTCSQGGGDCNDNNAAVNPGAKEICLNGLDDNCSGSPDEKDAVGCQNHYKDLDGDKFGEGAPICLCSPSGAYSTTKGGDCNDADKNVKPEGQPEICGNGKDDDCTGTQNDQNAQGCKDFFIDNDGDGYGKLPKKCMCFAEGIFNTPKGGDCDDADKGNSPGNVEVCDDKDNNCDGKIDEGCDDDDDGFCDNNLIYKSVGGSKDICATATENTNLALNCGPDSSITNITFASFGTPTGTCGAFSKGACDATASLQKIKDACLGKSSCVVAANSTVFGDPCGGVAKALNVEVVCTSSKGKPPKICPKGPGDMDDEDPNINPSGDEVCDGIDNNQNGQTDEKCDKDDDDYCDKDRIVVGAPPTCKKGGNDCNDENAGMNPGNVEDCKTPWDDNCNGETNDIDAKNCTPLFFDNDQDLYGTSDFKCLCETIGKYTALKTADCNDNNADLNPGKAEICDGIDNNCDGQIDEGCDDDKDGYCDAALGLAPGATSTAVCPNGGGDCDDTKANVNPGKAEVCGDGIDNDCDGTHNDPDAMGCTDFYSDVDGDSFGSKLSKCLCEASGTFSVSNSSDCDDSSADIKPGAVEVCDDKDNNCDGNVDEGCDDDKDGYCDSKMVLVGKPKICPKGGLDCNDTDSTANPGVSQEICDGVDNDCNGQIDDGCDKDKDGYCDQGYQVSNPPPAICSKGTGDCNDYNNDQNPGETEICGNGLDDDCDGSENNENATNCTDYYFDADADGYGIIIKKCYCKPAGLFTALKGGDCADDNKAVNPGKQEICGNGLDDDCSGSQNDDGALNCTDFYLDQDSDGYGLKDLKKCLCEAADSYTAKKDGDCDDTLATVSPGNTEVCDDVDNDCDSKVDTGCNDDGDDYCDDSMKTVGFPNVCAKGGGDCDDGQQTVNPGHPEWCDTLDNNCDGKTDDNCDDDKDGYCDSNMTTVGKPSTCPQGGGDCKDDDKGINPGVKEDCATPGDDDCSGTANDEGAKGCTNYGLDADGDTYSDKNSVNKCLCKPDGILTGTKKGDCDDANKLVNPAMTEICDGVDNDCDGGVDEGCDGDGDGYCASDMVTIGTPKVCPQGGGDCNDADKNVNPGAQEICNNQIDENCDNDLNSINAKNCTDFYYDGDSDGWAVAVSQCLCVPKGSYKITDKKKLGDCDDTTGTVNPAAPEVCGDGLDNNCNGTQNDPSALNCKSFYADNDKDGFGGTDSACLCVAEGKFVTSIGGDCNENDGAINPGAKEICDDKDNNCNKTDDEGCDDDGDGYCDSELFTEGQPKVCPNGGGDCKDTDKTINPGVTEKCDDLDDDCDGKADNGCDKDNDGYCDKTMTIVGKPAVCNKGTGDCDDINAQVNPSKTEICDDADNNCDGIVDEKCDEDGDGYCTLDMAVLGKPGICAEGGGDCNDADKAINPGAAELCNGKDDNCAGGIDEVCVDKDGDGFCVGNVGVSKVCTKGGKDCNDGDPAVNPDALEDCSTPVDDNCNGILNEIDALNCTTLFEDLDSDGYGQGTGACLCQQQNKYTATRNNDCDETDPKINPAAKEICDGLNNDCDFQSFAGATYKGSIVTMDTKSYGGTYHLFRKEYWYPQWSSATVYRYDDKYAPKGTHSTGLGNHRQIAGDPLEDNYYTIRYTGSSSNDRVRKHKGITSSVVWTAPYVTNYLSAVATDKDGVYTMRYNSQTVYVFNRSNGQKSSQYNLSGYWDGNYVWGGLFVAEGKLYRGGYSNRWFTRYDAKTGVYDGYRFQVSPTIYTAAYNGKDVCVSSGSSSVYCYNVPSASAFSKRTIGINPYGRGGGYHLKHKEYWYPEWSGSNVHRYSNKYEYLGKFDNGLSSVAQIWGSADEDDYYLTRYSSSSSVSRVYKLKDKSKTQVWNQYLTTYMSGVAADKESVYAMRYSGSTVYVLNKANGSKTKQFNLNNYSGTLYGGLAVVDGKLYRGDYSGRKLWRYDLATGVHDGLKIPTNSYIWGLAFNGQELCTNNTSGLPECYKLPPKSLDYSPVTKGVISHGQYGGYNLFRKEYWYPNNNNPTTIYRYDENQNSKGVITGLPRYLRQVTSDTDEDNYYSCSYTSSSTYSRCYKFKGTTSTQTWKSPYFTTYLGGVAADKTHLYVMRYYGSKVYAVNKSNGNRDTSKEFSLNSYSGNTFGIAIHKGKFYRANTSSQVRIFDMNGKYTNSSFGITYPYGVAYTGTKMCINSSSTISVPTCYDLDLLSNTGSSTQTQMNTGGYGGGYHTGRNEWWYPQYASTTMHRYDKAKKYVGQFSTGISNMTQMANDPDADSYYVARWYGSSWSGYSYVTRLKGTSSSQDWTTRYKDSLTYYLSGVAVHKDHVLVTGYNSSRVYALRRKDGSRDTSKEFNLSTYTYKYGGIVVTGDTLWGGRWNTMSEFEIGSGQETGRTFTAPYTPYSLASDGKDWCFGTSSSSSKAVCYPLPTAGAVQSLGVKHYGYGAGFHPYYDEYLFSNGNNSSAKTIYRYDLNLKSKGSYDSGLTRIYALTGAKADKDVYAVRYSGNSSESRAYRLEGMTDNAQWISPYLTTYLSGIALDDDYAYVARYNSSTIYRLNNNKGTLVDSFSLTGTFGGSMYGGLTIADGKIYRANTSRQIRRYDLKTGAYDNLEFQLNNITPYGSAFNGTEICYTGSSTTGQLECIKLPPKSVDFTARPLGMDVKGEGMGFHSFHNEYWFPEWSGGWIWRYDINGKQLNKFNSGLTSTRQVWGARVEDAFYTVQYNSNQSMSRVRKLKGKTNTLLWMAPELSSYMSGVSADDNAVYATRYSGNQVWELNPDTGSVTRTFNLTGNGAYDTTYGGLMVESGKIWKVNSGGNAYRFNLSDGANDGMGLNMNMSVRGIAFNGTELCVSNGSLGPIHCYALYDANNGAVDEGCDDDGDGYCDGDVPLTPKGAGKTCPKTKTVCDGVEVGGYCYKAINSKTTWPQAQKGCEDWGGDLTTVQNSDEGLLVHTEAGKTCGGIDYWIGYTDKDNEKNFSWVDGTVSGYTNWAIGEPTSGDGPVSCAALLNNTPDAPDGMYKIDPDGAGPLPMVEVFCDMKKGGWTLAGNFYDSTGDDMPNDTSYVVSGWQQTASGKWNNKATKITNGAAGTSAALGLEYIAAMANKAGQKSLRFCFVGKDGKDTECRDTIGESLTLGSFDKGNAKLTKYKDDKLTYTYGRLAGLAGSSDGYDPSKYVCGGGYHIKRKKGKKGVFGETDAGFADQCNSTGSGAYYGVWHGSGCGISYRPWKASDIELGGGSNDGCGFSNGANPSPDSYGFRLYVGPATATSTDKPKPSPQQFKKSVEQTFNGSGSSITLTFSNLPKPTTTPKIKIGIWGDYNSSSEYGTVYFDNSNVGQVGGYGPQCGSSPTEKTFDVSTSYVNDGTLVVRIQNTYSVGSFCNPNKIKAELTYTYMGLPTGGNNGGGNSGTKQVWTKHSYGQNPTWTMGNIPGKAGSQIIIHKIGICGDSDSGSGANRFRLYGGGVDYTWAAGQSQPGQTHWLGYTPYVNSSGRGFVYKDVNYTLSEGSSATIQWNYHSDWDGRYCTGTDVAGNSYNDQSSTVRAWVQYSYTGDGASGGNPTKTFEKYETKDFNGSGTTVSLSFNNLPKTTEATAQLVVGVIGDYGSSSEYADITADGQTIGTVGNESGGDCNSIYSPKTKSFTINTSLIEDGSLKVDFKNTNPVNDFCSPNRVFAKLTYQYANNKSNQVDYVAVRTDTKWTDEPNDSKRSCFVCKRKVTVAQYGKGDDCADEDAQTNPSTPEVCDGKDNNCNGAIDEGCDDDKDGYCDAKMVTVGSPAICVQGGADCDDFNADINPGKKESCKTDYDDNCDGLTTALNADGCTNLFVDNDGDGYGGGEFQCQCAGQTCQATPYKEGFDTKLSGWSFLRCSAGNYSDPTNCKTSNTGQGWQQDLTSSFVGSGKGGLYYGDPKLSSYDFGSSAGVARSATVKLPSKGTPKLKASLYLGVDKGKTTDDFSIRVLDASNGKLLKTVWAKNGVGADPFPGSVLLQSKDKTQLNTWLGKQETWSLCYRRSTHGASANTFNSRCANKGPTMTVIRTQNNYVFGGYNSQSWQPGVGYKYMTDGWLYSLTRGTKHAWYRYGQYGTYNQSYYGPTWGGGHDLYISSDMRYYYSYLGHTYRCPPQYGYGSSGCMSWLAGNYSGSYINEIEVYVAGSGGVNNDAPKWENIEVDLAQFVGKDVKFEFYFNTVNGSDNKGLGVIVDNLVVTDSTCSKYSAKTAGDCDDNNALKFPSADAEICDGVDNNCNGVKDEGCDYDKDGFCDASKPLYSTFACPKTGTKGGGNCTLTEIKSPQSDGVNRNHTITYGYGGDYHPFRKEIWMLNWSSQTTAYRYSKDLKSLGSFNTNTYYARDVAGSTKDDNYFIGSYYNYRVYKKQGTTNSQLWQSNSIGSYLGGVAADSNYVYAMRVYYWDRTVWVYNQSNGSQVKTFNLNGNVNGYLYGGFTYANGKLYRATSDRNVVEYLASNGNATGRQWSTSQNTYKAWILDDNLFCNTEYGNSKVDCYPLTTANCKTGDDCNDKQAQISPNAVEVCDDADNDCDGKTDPKCNEDGDAYCGTAIPVIGTPKVCPKGGGDCNDNDKAVSPDTVEVCDGKDNNCDKVIDPANSKGCSTYYYDGDLDGYGAGGNAQCLCKAAGVYNATKAGDCNDQCADCKPGGTEICDDKDNDCDSAVDEQCDKDGDGYCDDKMLTINKPKACPLGGGDCNESAKSINPGKLETCNNQDDNCNGLVDENADNECNNSAKNAVAKCIKGKCVNMGCAKGFFDLNNTMADGCECNGNDNYEPNETCGAATRIGTELSDEGGGDVEIFTGMMVDKTDIDWYKVYARDKSDGGSSACDNFGLRLRFLKNPGGRYRFSVWRGECPPNNSSSGKWWKDAYGRYGNPSQFKTSANNVCCGQTDFNWFTSFKSYTRHPYSSYDSEYGECSCHTSYGEWSRRPGWDKPQGGPYGRWKNQFSPSVSGAVYMPSNSRGYGYARTWCNDDSSWYYVKVYKAGGTPTCGGYVMEVSNGVYKGSNSQRGYNHSGKNSASPTPQ